jgi:hypothetical protein
MSRYYPSHPLALVKERAAQKTFLTTLCLDGLVALLGKLADQSITHLQDGLTLPVMKAVLACLAHLYSCGRLLMKTISACSLHICDYVAVGSL